MGDMSKSKKIVVKLELHDKKDKQKAMKAVSALVGIDAVSIDMATRKMTVIGMVDPVDVVSKLRKTWAASIDSVGPAKEPEKKKEEDGKKEGAADSKKEGEGAKKEGDGKDKKEGDGKDEAKKEDGEKKPPQPTEQQLIAELMNQYRSAYAYHNPYMNNHYVVESMEENPNSCAIC